MMKKRLTSSVSYSFNFRTSYAMNMKKRHNQRSSRKILCIERKISYMELQNRLHNIKKGSSTTEEYITPIKSNAEILEVDGQPIDQASLTYLLI